jgi:hypothetical protein
MTAISGNEPRTIRVGDDFVQAATGRVEHTLYRTVRGIEYKFEVCAPIDRYTAEKIVRKIK